MVILLVIGRVLSYILMDLLNSLREDNGKMIGICLECITIVIKAIGKEHSKSFLENFLGKISALLCTTAKNYKEKDVFTVYLIASWERLFSILKSELISYIPGLFTLFFELFIKVFKNFNNQKILFFLLIFHKETSSIDDNDVEISEITTSIKFWDRILIEIGPFISDYLPALIQLIVPLTTYQLSDEIRLYSVKLFPQILTAYRNCSSISSSQQGIIKNSLPPPPPPHLPSKKKKKKISSILVFSFL